MKKFALAILIACMSQIYAAEAIKDAFGITFGDFNDFIKWPHNKEETKEIGLNTYRFERPIGYRIFTKCWFKTTPKTKKIFKIYSFYNAQNELEAEKEVNIIKEAVKQKYKNKIKEYKSKHIKKYNQAILFRSGNRYIQILRDKKKVYISYGDYDWQILNKQEAIKDDIQKSPDDGL